MTKCWWKGVGVGEEELDNAVSIIINRLIGKHTEKFKVNSLHFNGSWKRVSVTSKHNIFQLLSFHCLLIFSRQILSENVDTTLNQLLTPLYIFVLFGYSYLGELLETIILILGPKRQKSFMPAAQPCEIEKSCCCEIAFEKNFCKLCVTFSLKITV